MELNPEILEILKEFKINKDEGVLCLLGIYFKLDIEKVCSEDTIKAINLTKIVEKDYTKLGKELPLKWNTPLFLGQQTDWDWVKTEWLKFWDINKERKDSSTDCIKRMQEFFKKYPKYRKDDVMRATANYFKTIRDVKVVKTASRFIFDGTGAMKVSMLLAWCEKLEQGGSSSQMRGTLVQ